MRTVLLSALILAGLASSGASAADLAYYRSRTVYLDEPPAIGGSVPRAARYVRLRHLHAPSGYAYARSHGQIILVDTETSPRRVADIVR